MVACGWQVLELFKAADKYDVPGLVKECVQIFRKITRSADVAPLLQVSFHSLLLLFPLRDDVRISAVRLGAALAQCTSKVIVIAASWHVLSTAVACLCWDCA